LECTNVTDSEAATIGTRLALSQGLSEVIAMMKPEMTALDRTVTASGTMLQTLLQFGGRLGVFNVNAAPTAIPLLARQSPEAQIERLGSDVPQRTGTPAVARPTKRDVSGSLAKSDLAALPRLETIPRSDGSLPSRRSVSLQTAPMIAHAAPPLADVAQVHTSRAVFVPTATSSGEPPLANRESATAPSIASYTGEAIRSMSSEVDALRAAAAPVTATDEFQMPIDTQAEQIVVGTGASDRSAQVAVGDPVSQPATGRPAQRIAAQTGGFRLMTPAPSWTAAGAASQSDWQPSTSAASEEQRTEGEPRQGTLVMDGTQLGRWMIDHLERHASRPGAMTTGIDPRMSATYPGAPTGA
jgi:hypothetical protein